MDSHRHLNISNGSFRPHVGYHFPPGDHNGTGRGLPGLNQTILNLTGYLLGVHECITCPAGTSCAVGSNEPKDCMPGSYAGSASSESCDLCAAGKWVGKLGQTVCNSW